MEWWSAGTKGNTPLLQHSITPNPKIFDYTLSSHYANCCNSFDRNVAASTASMIIPRRPSFSIR